MERRLRLEKAWLSARLGVNGFALGPLAVYHRGVKLQQQTVVDVIRARFEALPPALKASASKMRLVVVYVANPNVERLDGFAGFTGGLWDLGYAVQSTSPGWPERLGAALDALWKNQAVEPTRDLFDGI